MKKQKTEGVLIPAFLLIGLSIGVYYNQTVVGTLIGLGVGFLAFYISGKKNKK